MAHKTPRQVKVSSNTPTLQKGKTDSVKDTHQVCPHVTTHCFGSHKKPNHFIQQDKVQGSWFLLLKTDFPLQL